MDTQVQNLMGNKPQNRIENLLAEILNLAPFVRQALLEWYAVHGRVSLPWRNLKGENAPYGVYVSEIMLQQTQVSRVLGMYYEPFMKTFPTLVDLANAPEELVLKMWEGLGYYSRARNLHKSAKICSELYDGRLPKDYSKLLSLPGIGKYSAGAIACFGFGESVGFVDGNIRRVFCRLFALNEPKQSELEDYANLLVDPLQSFEYNQALLDVGALICTPKSPLCGNCPLESLCRGKHSPHCYPAPKPRSLKPLTLHLGIYVDSEGRIGVSKSSQKLYHGLYNLPVLDQFSAQKCGRYRGECKHHYTIYAICAKIWAIPYEKLSEIGRFELGGLQIQHAGENACSTESSAQNLEFFTLQELESKPLSSLCKKALKAGGFVV